MGNKCIIGITCVQLFQDRRRTDQVYVAHPPMAVMYSCSPVAVIPIQHMCTRRPDTRRSCCKATQYPHGGGQMHAELPPRLETTLHATRQKDPTMQKKCQKYVSR